MLENNDSLPEEQAYPELLQELQATYHIKQEEEQVLERVRERLLKRTVQPISLKELTPLEDSPQDRRTRLQSSPFRRPAQRKWVRLINTLAATLLVATLVGALAFTLSRINNSRNLVASPTSPEMAKTFVDVTEGLRLYMVNEQIGWEIGDDAHSSFATVLRTTDGGHHWQSVTPAGLHLVGTLYIIDENTAWVPVWNSKKSIYPTALYRTINGGTTWQYFDCPGSLTCGSSIFADQNHGWLIDQPSSDTSLAGLETAVPQSPVTNIVKPELYHTSDGGKTWQTVATFSVPISASQLRFLNAQTGWTSSLSEFYVTHDGGYTWAVQHLPIPPGEQSQPQYQSILLQPTFLNEREGYLIARFSSHSYLYITQDGGNSWQIRGNALPGGIDLKNLLDLQHIVASVPLTTQGSYIVMFTLINGQWKKTTLSLPDNSPVVDYSFTSKDVGIALVNASPSTFDMYKTTDGGQTWQKISTQLRSS
jgi:photosystem II stability/assembly factor-like uncharacterized protein